MKISLTQAVFFFLVNLPPVNGTVLPNDANVALEHVWPGTCCLGGDSLGVQGLHVHVAGPHHKQASWTQVNSSVLCLG